MKTLYGYQLTLSFYNKGTSVKDYTSGSGVDFCAKFNNHINTKLEYKKNKDDANTTSFGEMNLSSLSYLKQLYSPNCIKVSIECSDDLGEESMLELAKLFKEARAKLDVVKFTETEDGRGIKRKSVDETGAKKIADKYEVYESSPRYDSSQKKMYIDLVIYSPDKVLDTFEYSKAYTNKRLGLDIFSKEAKTIYSDLGLECSNMQVLRLKTGDEFSQPYLVQYNETFYSFLSRVANRCGEFLYYENDKLSLGIKLIEEKDVKRYDKKLDKYVTDKQKQYNFTFSDFDKISFTDFNTSHNRETDLEDFYSNYMVKNAPTPSKSFVRNSELSGNEYFETVTKDGFSSTGDERAYVGYGLFNTVGTIFTNTMGAGLFLAGVNIIKQNTWDVSQKAKAVNEHFNDKFFKGEKDSVKSKKLFGSKDAPMVSIDKDVVNVNSVFYPLVRNKEMDLKRRQASLRIDTNISKNVMLGDRINLFGKEYVVVKVTASFNIVVNPSGGNTETCQPIDVVAVPVEGVPLPTYSVEPIRKIGCQKAFVTDVDDPSFLGRVQVRFSWQKVDGDSSPWIRVCSQMANSNGGVTFFKAAKGDSVLIDFENGNADMPYVSGFLPTMDQQKNKGQYLSRHNSVVVSSEHGQMMLMSDPTSGTDFIGAGGIPILRKVLSFLPSDNPVKTRFLGSTEFTDYYGIYSVKMSSSDRSVTIDSPYGKVAMNAFTGISINAPNGDINIAGKNITLTAGNNITIESGVNAIKGSTRYYSDLIFGAVGDLVTDTLMPMVLDLSYLRNVIEIFIKPCEGTLSLKSGRYLLLQAGGAAPKVPCTGFVIPQAGMANYEPEREKIAALHNALNFIDGAVKSMAYCISEMKNAVKETQETWDKEFFYKDDKGKSCPKIKDEEFNLNKLVNEVNKDRKTATTKFKPNENFNQVGGYLTGYLMGFLFNEDLTKIIRKGLTEMEIQKLANSANNMIKKLRAYGFLVKLQDNKLTIDNSENSRKCLIDNLMKSATLDKDYEEKIKSGLKGRLEVGLNGDGLPKSYIKESRRTIAKAVLDAARSKGISGISDGGNPDCSNDDSWETYVGKVFKGEKLSFWGQVGASAFNAFKTVVDKLNPLQQVTGKWVQGGRRWSADRRGQILMSDTEGTTMYFNNGTLKSFSNSDLYSVKNFCKKYL